MGDLFDQVGNLLNSFDQFGQTYFSFFVEQNTWIFIILTCMLGGGAAFAAGRSLALSWRPYRLLFIYMLIFTCGIRFLHVALFESALTSLQYYISHGLVIQLCAFPGYRMTMARQMAEKYRFAFVRTRRHSRRGK